MPVYYVKNDGNDSADGLSDANAWATVAKVVASSFAAGDQILFKRGSTWAETLFFPSSGASGNPIVIGDYGAGALPVITSTNRPIDINIKNWITVQNLNLGGAADVRSVWIRGAATTGITVTGCTFNATQYGVNCSVQLTDSTFADNTATTAITVYAISCDGAASSNVSISGLTSAKGGVYLANCTNGAVTSSTITDSPAGYPAIRLAAGLYDVSGTSIVDALGYGVKLEGALGSSTIQTLTISGGGDSSMHLSGVTGGVSIRDCSLSGQTSTNAAIRLTAACDTVSLTRVHTASSAGGGVYADGSCTAITIDGCNVTGGTGAGHSLVACTSSTIQHCVIRGTSKDGIVTNTGSSSIAIQYNLVVGNGDKTTTTEGDGVTCHSTDSNITIRYNLIAKNTASGVGCVGSSSGSIYNNVVYANGGDWSVEGGGKLNQVRGGIWLATDAGATGWVVRNNVVKGNYTHQFRLSAHQAAIIDSDYNCVDEDAYSVASLDQGATTINWATYSAREPHSINADPLMVDPAGENFRLCANSPCIDAGANLSLTRDYADRNVPWGRGPDIGALEYVPNFGVNRLRSGPPRLRVMRG